MIDIEKLRAQVRKNKRPGRVIMPPNPALSVAYQKDIRTLIQDTIMPGVERALNYAEQTRVLYEVNNSVFQYLRLSLTLEKALQKTAEKLASKTLDYQNEKHRARFRREMSKALGVPISDVLLDSNITADLMRRTRQNVDLIVDLTKDEYTKINQIFTKGFASGDNYSNIRDEIKKHIFDLGQGLDYRAKVIARDQTNKLNGELNKTRQSNLGVTSFFWRTSMDGRERDSHAAVNGDEFKWTDDFSETDGPPGQAIMCRCYAEPNLEQLRADLLGEEYRYRK